MPWYGWVLIVVGVVALGALKLYVFGKMKDAKKKQVQYKDEE
jgi:hypothetical protein